MCGDEGSDPTQYDRPTPTKPLIHEVSGAKSDPIAVLMAEHSTREERAAALLAFSAEAYNRGWNESRAALGIAS